MADSDDKALPSAPASKPGQRETLRIPTLPPRPLRPATAKIAPRPATAGGGNVLPLTSGKGFIPVPASAPGWSTAVTKPLSMGADPAAETASSSAISPALTPPIAPARPIASALPPAPARPVAGTPSNPARPPARPGAPALSGASPTSKTTPIRTPDGYINPNAAITESGPLKKEAAQDSGAENSAAAPADVITAAPAEAISPAPRVIVAPPTAKVFLEPGDLALPADLETIDFNSQAPAKMETQALPMSRDHRAHVHLDVSVPLAEPIDKIPDTLPPQPSLNANPPLPLVVEAEAVPVETIPSSLSPTEVLFNPPSGPVVAGTAAPTPPSSYSPTMPIARPVRSSAPAPSAGSAPRPNSATRAFATDRLPEVGPGGNGSENPASIAPPLTPSDPQLSTLSRPVMPLNVVATGPFPSPSSITASPAAPAATPATPPPKIALATPPPARVPAAPMPASSEDRTQVLPLPPKGIAGTSIPRPPVAPPMPESRSIEVSHPAGTDSEAGVKAMPTPPAPPARPLATTPAKVVAPPRRTQTGPINLPKSGGSLPTLSKPGAITARLETPPVPTPIRSNETIGTPTTVASSPVAPGAIAPSSVKPAPLAAVPVPKPIAPARPVTPALPQPVATPSAAATPKPALPVAAAPAAPPKPVMPVAPNAAGMPPKPVMPVAPNATGMPPKPVMPVAPNAAVPSVSSSIRQSTPPPPPGVAAVRPVASVRPVTGTPTPVAPVRPSDSPASGTAPTTPPPPPNAARVIPPKETARITIKPNRPGGTARLAGAVKPLISTLPANGTPSAAPTKAPSSAPTAAAKAKPTMAPTSSPNHGSKPSGSAPTTVPVNTFDYEKSTRVSTIAAGVLALLTWSVAGYLSYVAFLS